jgi:hypothetical protein
MTNLSRRAILALLVVALPVLAAEPIESGLKPGQRPGPYTSLVSVGPQRGQLHCFICETEDKPAVVVFARSLSDGLGKLVRGLDKAVQDNKKADLRAWVTFLNDDQQKFDPLVVAWGKQQSVKSVPLAIFEDLTGPPTFRLHRGADLTILLFVKQKVVKNFSYKDGSLTDAQLDEVLKGVSELVK